MAPPPALSVAPPPPSVAPTPAPALTPSTASTDKAPAIFIPKIPSVAAPTPISIPAKPVTPTIQSPDALQTVAAAPAAPQSEEGSAAHAASRDVTNPAPAPRPLARIVSHSAPAPAASAPAPPQPVAGLRINKETPAPVAAQVETPQAANPNAPKPCFRHMGQFAVEKCYVCSKPICPKCMELFGYVCSPLCKSKAEAQGIEVPVFEGQRDVKEARSWRKTVLVTTTACAMIAVALGGYIWWLAYGSRPHTVFSVRFGERAHSGQSSYASKDQIVFLHGGTLARHDMKQKKEIWSMNLINDKDIDAQVAKEMEEAKKEIDWANSNTPESVPKMPRPDKLKKELIREAAASMRLRIVGQNIWIMTPNKLIRFDWDTGKTNKEIALKEEWGQMLRRGDELMTLENQDGKPTVTRINLDTCDVRSEDIPLPPRPVPTVKTNRAGAKAPSPSQQKSTVAKKSSSGGGGLPTVPGKNSGKPLDPAKVAEQASHLSLPAKIALPAILANTVNQDRSLAELDDENGPPRKPADPDDPSLDYFVLIPTRDGFLQFSLHLLEHKLVARTAMKAPPKKSALEGNASVANTTEIANEILNEMQRNYGGDTVTEDESRYLIKLQSPGGSNAWSGEIIGPPKLFPLKTVTVLASNKKVTVFDKTNKKLWEGTLNYNVPGGSGELDEEEALTTGEGPCVEHKDALYVFDQGVLTAFDLKTGNARWRLPCVGITGIFFDEKDNLYVNGSDAGPDTIKYSKQIDVSGKVNSVIQKVDAQTGKVIWNAQPGGAVSYVSGPYIYVVQSYSPDEDDEDDVNPYSVTTGFETPPYVRIRRINPKNGKEMWEHFQQRAPLDVEFDKNTIRLVFRKEVQVLKTSTF
jgi:hypothetical protein